MKKSILFCLLSAAFLLPGAEVRFPRQALPRSNSIRVDDVVLTVNRDDASASKWVLEARKGEERRKVAVVRDGINRLWFPDTVLEIRNWNIPMRESWNILAETIGDYQIRVLKPEELLKNASFRTEEKSVAQRRHFVVTNGWLTVECIPAFNGIVNSLRDEIDGREFFASGSAAGTLTLKSFRNVGFVEMFDTIGKMPEAAMSWECRGGVVRMSGDCGILPGAVLEREMRLSPEGFSFRLKSAVRPVKKGLNTVLMLKHRPEMRMFRTLGAPSVNLMMPENGRLKARALQTGSACETHENAYVVADSAGGVLLGIRYENADNLYFWYDKEYFAPEAMGRKLNIGERPSMTVDYFVVHGMSRADFIGVDTVLALAEKPLTVQENSAYQLDLVCGSAVRLRNPRLKVHFLNEAGKILAEKEGTFQAPAPGFATAFSVALPCEKLPAGAYRLELCLSSGGKILLTGRTDFRVLSKNDLKQGEERLKQINRAIDTVRSEFRKGGDRQELMKRFKSLIEQRKKLEDAISSGDQTVLDTLLRKPGCN